MIINTQWCAAVCSSNGLVEAVAVGTVQLPGRINAVVRTVVAESGSVIGVVGSFEVVNGNTTSYPFVHSAAGALLFEAPARFVQSTLRFHVSLLW